MTPKEAARVILLDSVNRALDGKSVAWSADGHEYAAIPYPSKSPGAWRISGNSSEWYTSLTDILGKLISANAVIVIEDE